MARQEHEKSGYFQIALVYVCLNTTGHNQPCANASMEIICFQGRQLCQNCFRPLLKRLYSKRIQEKYQYFWAVSSLELHVPVCYEPQTEILYPQICVPSKRSAWDSLAPEKRGYLHKSFHENICCGYSLEVPCKGTSNEYPQHMFFVEE